MEKKDYYKYYEKIQNCQEKISDLEKQIALALEALNKGDEQGIAFKKLSLANEMLNLASTYMTLSEISNVLFNHNDENSLEESRRAFVKALDFIEEVVTRYVDVPFSDYEEKLAVIAPMSWDQRFNFIKKAEITLDYLLKVYENDTKWKWPMVEILGRFAAVAKNIIDFKNVSAYFDFDSPFNLSARQLVDLVKKTLLDSANGYRRKYEASTKFLDDFNKSIYFLSALRRVHLAVNEVNEAIEVKKMFDAWLAKCEGDLKNS